ncbi:hypothetical protein [Sporomusa sp.]|uniref:hypothetical protein n=1 Tax=Sporomusa sp. TaxID=2078658 RepID=UPI002BDA4672|nr:hypothetical protein [Sporomusa sp.]HWR10110.1 hypothetical protein [Sporomusa sp.]
MSSETIISFYESLGFEETEIEDSMVVLGIELTPAGNYALITNDEGTMPKDLNQGIIFAYYTPEDSYLWSASFKSSTAFKELWTEAPTNETRLDAIVKHREANETF